MRVDGPGCTLQPPALSDRRPLGGSWESSGLPKTGSMHSGLPKRHAVNSCSLPELPKSDSLDCPRVPGLAWGRLVGCGSFGRVYKGAPSFAM